MQTHVSRLEKPDFQVLVHPNRIEGWVRWQDDALFRPTIGVFVNDMLTRLVPTTRFQREDADGEVAQLCRFDIPNLDVPGITAASSLMISCLEKSQVLRTIRPAASGQADAVAVEPDTAAKARWPKSRSLGSGGFRRLLHQIAEPQAATRNDRGVVDVEAILEAGRQGARAFGHGGFLRFLSLPLIDQLNILFLDLLDRGVDPKAMADYLDRITADQATILDIRDEVLNSEEFLSRGPVSPDMLIGAWCTWDGLNHVDPALLSTLDARNPPLTAADGGVLKSYIGLAASGRRLPRHLARIALGPVATEQACLNWCRNHFHVICKFDAELHEDLLAGNAAPARKDDRHPIIRNVLGTVSVGKAGRRVDEAIHSRPGRSGHLTFGPYIKLPAGTHRISLGYQATMAPGATSSSVLTVEVVGDDVLFARSDVRIEASGLGTIELDFVIPRKSQKLTLDVGFEFRISVDGRSDIAVETMTCTQNIGDEGAICYPNVARWLNAMSIGPMASRNDAGEIACSPSANSGYAVFGPYVKLLPGLYMLTVQIICDVLGRSAKNLTVEVTEPTGTVVSSPVPLALGQNKAALAFTVASAPNLVALRGPFEFRVKSEAGIGFRLSDIMIERT